MPQQILNRQRPRMHYDRLPPGFPKRLIFVIHFGASKKQLIAPADPPASKALTTERRPPGAKLLLPVGSKYCNGCGAKVVGEPEANQ